jgi:hypothetical protein
MKLEKALKLLNRERLDYLESFNYGCPDVDEKEHKALEAVQKYVAKIQQEALDQLGQTYTY